MRFNRVYPLSALISAIFLILFCSRSDVITGAGGSAVTDFNPNLTDLHRGFVTITMVDTAAGTAFSLPPAPDPLFGTFIADNMLIGLSDDGDTLAAHIQYSIAGDTSYDVAKDTLIRAYICFRAADGDSVQAGAAITLFPGDTLRGFAPANRAGDGGADNTVGSFSLSGGDICSLLFRDDLADSIFRARASRDTGLYNAFAFSIADYTGPLLKLDKPYIVVERMRTDCCPERKWVISDTIRGPAVRYSPFEDPDSAAKRAPEPYSSQITQRTAVFKVNAGKILDSLSRLGLSGDNSELLNAVITVRYNDPSDAGAKLLSRNVGNFKALILDTLLTEDIDTLSDSASHLLRYLFSKVGSTKLAKPYNTLSLKTAFRSVISKHTPGNTAYVYVYLRATTERSTIWWCKPAPTDPTNIHSVTVETVFTPHGLRRGNDINK
jgi:hypothetical protein